MDGFSGIDRRWIAMVRHYAATNGTNRDDSDGNRGWKKELEGGGSTCRTDVVEWPRRNERRPAKGHVADRDVRNTLGKRCKRA